MRYIDADKLIFKLNGSQVEFDEFYKGLGLAKQITDDMPTEDVRPVKWIPVSESLPEEGKQVLTYSNGGFIEIQSIEDVGGKCWENQHGDWSDIEEEVAWMPLPEPYREESEK